MNIVKRLTITIKGSVTIPAMLQCSQHKHKENRVANCCSIRSISAASEKTFQGKNTRTLGFYELQQSNGWWDCGGIKFFNFMEH